MVRKHLSVTSKEATFVIPDKVDLFDLAQYSIECKPRLAMQQGELLVVWRDKVVIKSELAAVIRIDTEHLVVDAASGAVNDSTLKSGLAAQA